jgi:hypothetical protein
MPPPGRALQPAGEAPPQANSQGTFLALIGIAATGMMMSGSLPSDIARFAAIGVGISLAVSAVTDLKLGGFKNLIRADLMAILAFYFLTLFEFLFPQPNYDAMVGPRLTSKSIIIVMLGFAGLLIGRHLLRPKRQPFEATLTRELRRVGSSSSSGPASLSAISTCSSRWSSTSRR